MSAKTTDGFCKKVVMRRLLVSICAFLFLVTSARGADSTSAADDAFAKTVDLDAIRSISVQHNQTIKTFDTYARDVLFAVTAKSTLDGKSAAFVVIDMALRPEQYGNRNLIYIRNKPFRADFASLSVLKDKSADADRIVKEGTISLAFWLDPHVQAEMQKIMSTAMVKADAIQQINGQAAQLAQLLGFPSGERAIYRLAILPPLNSPDANAKPWLSPQALFDDAAKTMAQMTGSTPPATLPTTIAGYAPRIAGDVLESLGDLREAWLAQDLAKTQLATTKLAAAVQEANPAIYPSKTKRSFEVLYNSLYRLTMPAVAFYFVGFVLFLLAWKTDISWLYRSAVGFTIGGWLVHLSGIAIRWWLIEKSVGNWLDAIPIKNQFESVLMSAFSGVTVALLLERWKRFGIFGAAAAFIGMLSLVAIASAPYITGRDIGGEIKQHAGILMTYWLYVHVTLVTASYALIGMTFVMGVWYIVQYLSNRDADVLKTIDDCNLIMLQLAFWILGIGIITGALWADVSWGRPWGWDPKETFALITWIVYLVIIHVRFITSGQQRALITGILSVVGFAVMLFNWWGVNFFLVGLHSYA